MLRLVRLLGFRQIAAERENAMLRRQLANKEAELADKQAELRAAFRTIAVKKHELKLLAGIIARDRERVQAETAISSAQIAAVQQGAGNGRTDVGVPRR